MLTTEEKMVRLVKRIRMTLPLVPLLLAVLAALLLAAPAALALGIVHGGSYDAHPTADTRRGRFIPAPSRAALDEMASDIRKLRVRRHGSATYPAMGRVDAALHALLGLIPYPTEPEERELMEDALRCLEATAPDVARPLAERMRAHYLSTATGGAHRAV